MARRVFCALGHAMFADGEFLMQFPCFIVKRADDKLFGYQSGNINGLPIYTDRAAADEVVASTKGLTLREFATSAALLAYLRSLTGGINHVVLDPMDGNLAGFVRLKVFIDTLAAAERA
jgi:hypothetical protein